MNPVVGIQKLAQAAVMIQCGDDKRNIFAHIRFNKPLGLSQFRLAVGQVGRYHPVDETVAVCLFEGVQAIGEQGKCAACEDAVSLAFFQLFSQINDAFTAGQSFPSTLSPRYSWATMGFRPFTMRV